MKTAVFSYYIHNPQGIGNHHTVAFLEEFPMWARVAQHYQKQYAKLMGADFYYTNQLYDPRWPTPHYEVLRPVYDPQFKQYDKVLFLDADVVPFSADNIFKMEVDGVAQFDEDQITDGGKVEPYVEGLKMTCFRWGLDIEKFKYPNGRWINNNSGVILWTREALDEAAKTKVDPVEYYNMPFRLNIQKLDQDYLRVMLIERGINMQQLPRKWHHKHNFGECTDGSNFFHYTTRNGKKTLMEVWG